MDQLAGVKRAIERLGFAKLAAMAAVAVAVLGLVAWVATNSIEPKGLLYAGLDVAEAGRIGQRLDEMKIPYEVKGDGTTIMAPAGQIPRIRMDLAAAGLPRQSGVGYELLDQQSPMNMTSFMQRVQRLRAMEGELARTIVTIQGVRTARVHIVLPDRETFARSAPKPTASVAVTMVGSGRLTIAQAAAIRLLVAGAVPGLQQDSVSVLDPNGLVLGSDTPETMASGRINELKAHRETSLQRTVTDLLEPLVGRGKVRVAASVDLDASREISREEKFDPMSQVERSKQTQIEQENADETKPREPVTVAQNLPNQPQNQNSAPNKTSSSATRNGQTINYEISSVRSERVREPGEVRRMTIAVVVDGITDEKGAYQPRAQEELTRFAELIEAAIGFDAKRGDRITVEAMRFVPVEPQGSGAEVEAANQMGVPWTWIIIGFLLAIVLVFALVTWRMRARHRLALELRGQAQLAGAGSADAAALAAPMGEAMRRLAADGVVTDAAGGIVIGDEADAPDHALVALFDLVDTRPDEAATVLRAWITARAA